MHVAAFKECTNLKTLGSCQPQRGLPETFREKTQSWRSRALQKGKAKRTLTSKVHCKEDQQQRKTESLLVQTTDPRTPQKKEIGGGVRYQQQRLSRSEIQWWFGRLPGRIRWRLWRSRVTSARGPNFVKKERDASYRGHFVSIFFRYLLHVEGDCHSEDKPWSKCNKLTSFWTA